MSFGLTGRVFDYIIEPVLISLPLPEPGKTKVTAVGCGRAHTVLATESEGGKKSVCCKYSHIRQPHIQADPLV